MVNARVHRIAGTLLQSLENATNTPLEIKGFKCSRVLNSY